MKREIAHQTARELLDKHGLSSWGIRLTPNNGYVGLCDWNAKVIYLNIHHVDTHPDSEIIDTIKHEIAHALTPNDGNHGDEWAAMAIKIGCSTNVKCSIPFSAEAIDAIRSGHKVEIIEKKSYEFKIDRNSIMCPVCKKLGKDSVAIVVSEKTTATHKVIKYDCGHIFITELPKPADYKSIVFDGLVICKHSWTLPVKAANKTICSKCNAKRPYPFQIEGMEAIQKGMALHGQRGFAILDSMGLGKTIQGLGYIKFLTEEQLPVLFVVKSGLKYQFASEIMRVLGDKYFPLIITSGKAGVIPGLKCYIIGYDTLRNFDLNKFKMLGIKLMVLDEVQQIKNPDSTRAINVQEMVQFIPKVLPLSGTPWKNRGSELFTMFNLLSPQKFPSFQKFLNDWVDYRLNSQGKYVEAGIKNPARFKEFVKDLCIRREPEQVMKEFPPLSRYQLLCEIPEVDQDEYNDEMDEFVQWFNDLALEGKNADSQMIIAKLSRLRHLIGQAKIPFTLEHVIDWIEDGSGKLLLGIHHKDVGDILLLKIEQFLREQGLTYKIPLLKITSDMNALARNAAQVKFNSTERCILIASTLAAGEGLNLQTGDYGILHERQWNPANEEQFEARLRRIGQLKRIKFDYIHAKGSIDEHFHNLVEHKRTNFNAVMNHDYDEIDESLPCKVCGKDKTSHEVAWDGDSLMGSLAVAIVEDANRNRKVKTVRSK